MKNLSDRALITMVAVAMLVATVFYVLTIVGLDNRLDKLEQSQSNSSVHKVPAPGLSNKVMPY